MRYQYGLFIYGFILPALCLSLYSRTLPASGPFAHGSRLSRGHDGAIFARMRSLMGHDPENPIKLDTKADFLNQQDYFGYDPAIDNLQVSEDPDIALFTRSNLLEARSPQSNYAMRHGPPVAQTHVSDHNALANYHDNNPLERAHGGSAPSKKKERLPKPYHHNTPHSNYAIPHSSQDPHVYMPNRPPSNLPQAHHGHVPYPVYDPQVSHHDTTEGGGHNGFATGKHKRMGQSCALSLYGCQA